MYLKSKYEVEQLPLSEYPRPQFVRDGYICLNGEWDFTVKKVGERLDGYDKTIIVPFSPEALNSGIGNGFVATVSDRLYYQKKFNLDSNWLTKNTILHFGAVDYSCEVFVNGKRVGEHEGGFTAFSMDISAFVNEGENTLNVVVSDSTEGSCGGRGKQHSHPGGIWYTAQSGIWQTVWLENLPVKNIADVLYTPNLSKNEIKIDVTCSDPVNYEVFDQDKLILSGTFTNSVILKYDFIAWSPENPKLYDVIFTTASDRVKSYFAIRDFSIITDKNGKRRLGLNGKPYFFSGILDQGYWSDGMLTPPSNAALEYDVKLVNSMGFNMIRKHIKIEPLRWYYHCDKEGILVWQDMVSGGEKYNFLYIGFLAFLEKHIKDDNPAQYKKLARGNEEGRIEFENEVRETMNHLKNVVSLSVWVPFNEGWGQFDSVRITKEMKKIDPTRIIDSVSGWNDQGKESSDLKSRHIYFKPITTPRKDKRCYVLSEFGGYSLPIKEHMFSNKIFGYRVFKTTDALAEGFTKLYEKSILPLVDKGLSATVYTQVSDVEEEINGLVTYDRKVVKFPLKLMKSLNDKLKITE